MLDHPLSPYPASTTPRLHIVTNEDEPVYDDPSPQHGSGFAMIPNEVLALNDGAAIAVYAILAAHADRQTGECWPSMKRLETALGWSETRIRPAIALLIKCNAIVKERRQWKGMELASLYRLTAYVRLPRGEATLPRGEAQATSPRSTGYLTTRYELEPDKLEPDKPYTTTPPVVPHESTGDEPQQSPLLETLATNKPRTLKQLENDRRYEARMVVYRAYCQGIGIDPEGFDAERRKPRSLSALKGIERTPELDAETIEALTRYTVGCFSWRHGRQTPELAEVLSAFAEWEREGRPSTPVPKTTSPNGATEKKLPWNSAKRLAKEGGLHG